MYKRYSLLLRIYFGVILILLGTVSYGCCEVENGGLIISLEEYGYQAAVHLIVKNEVVKICSGTIVSKLHILTTASCFSKAPNKYYDIQVRVGTVNVLSGGEVYNVSKVERHPEYNSYISTHNLAIIFVTSSIQFMRTPSVASVDGYKYLKSVYDVPLSDQFVSGGDEAAITGYSLKTMSTDKNNLHSMYTYTMSYFPCLDFFRDSVLSVELIDDEILCIRNNPSSSYCDILDGSPVVVDEKLVGVYLYSGGKCDDEKIPLLITRIANNLLWLHSYIDDSRFKGTGEICSIA